MNICIKNGTLISMSEKAPQVEYNKDILIENGKIVKIGENLKVENEFVKDLVYGVITYKSELDQIANSKIKDWTIDRIDKTGAAILRMGLYELKYMDTPEVVVINEAIELSKKYCDDSVRKIINAVLDKYIKE